MRTVNLAILAISTLLSCATLLASAQPSVTDPIYGICDPATFVVNDSFAKNLNAVADSLIHDSSRVLYSLASSQSGTPSNFVHAMYQCRGDISLSDCTDCVTNAFTRFLSTSDVSTFCGNLSKGAKVQFAGCFVRYDSYVFSDRVETGLAVPPICSGSANESSRLYQQNLVTALEDSAAVAPQHPLFGYNASRAGSGSSVAYALTQCLGSLNATECAACLSQVSNNSNICNGSVSGQVYFVDCYYLFGDTSLVFTYDNVLSPPPPPLVSPAISPPSSQPPATGTGSPLLGVWAGGGRNTNHRAAIIGIVVGILGLLAIIAAFVLCCFRRQKKACAKTHLEQKQCDADKLLIPEGGARKFSLKELQDATYNFNIARRLGEGGFGPVYQGRLTSGREVAIKVLSFTSRQGKSEFVNEVNLITRVQHRNLIQLLGFCEEDNKQLLVYEYLPNRSLDLCLFDVDENSALDWHARFDIIVGVARGLKYLHEDSHVRIVHRDIKASNILLDNNLRPKIADFGIARLLEDDATHLRTRVVGTLGYLAPEYAMGGQLSEKADVYSFGLLVLEIVSGRRVVEANCEVDNQNLLEWTWELYEKHQQLQILDERMQKAGRGRLNGNGSMHVNVGEVARVVHVALLCTQLQPQARPSMSKVFHVLCGQSEILNIPARPMTTGMLNPLTSLSHDGSSTSFSTSTMPSRPSLNSMYTYGAYSLSEIEAR